jgi:hypothetical protein
VGLIQLSLAPFQGDLWETLSPGLKPRAESSCPRGREPTPNPEVNAYGQPPDNGLLSNVPAGPVLSAYREALYRRAWAAVGPLLKWDQLNNRCLPVWRSFEPIPYTKRALRAKIVVDLIYPQDVCPSMRSQVWSYLLLVDLS